MGDKNSVTITRLSCKFPGVSSSGYSGADAHAILKEADHYLKKRHILGSIYTEGSPTEQAVNSTNDITNGIHGFDDHKVPRLFVAGVRDKDSLKRVKTMISSKRRYRSRNMPRKKLPSLWMGARTQRPSYQNLLIR